MGLAAGVEVVLGSAVPTPSALTVIMFLVLTVTASSAPVITVSLVLARTAALVLAETMALVLVGIMALGLVGTAALVSVLQVAGASAMIVSPLGEISTVPSNISAGQRLGELIGVTRASVFVAGLGVQVSVLGMAGGSPVAAGARGARIKAPPISVSIVGIWVEVG